MPLRIRNGIRIIAATNVDLPRAIAEGRFRNDLYYRLNVLHLEIPPLRGRGEDIALLAQHFLLGSANEMRSKVSGFSNDALRAMQHHDWPGNVRELMNRIRRATAICETRLIEASDLDLERRNGAHWLLTLASARAAVEQKVIKAALLRTSSNVSEAARQLGVSRGMLYLLIAKYGIEVRHVKNRNRSEAL